VHVKQAMRTVFGSGYRASKTAVNVMAGPRMRLHMFLVNGKVTPVARRVQVDHEDEGGAISCDTQPI